MAKTPLLLFKLAKYVFMGVGLLLLTSLVALTVYNKIRIKKQQLFESYDDDEQQEGPRLNVNETTPLLIE